MSKASNSKPKIRRRRAPDGASTAFTVCGACAKRHPESCRGWYWSWFVVELMGPTLVYDVFMLLATSCAKESTRISVVEPEHEIYPQFHSPPVLRVQCRLDTSGVEPRCRARACLVRGVRADPYLCLLSFVKLVVFEQLLFASTRVTAFACRLFLCCCDACVELAVLFSRPPTSVFPD